MASGTFQFYGKGVQAIVTGSIDLDTDSFKVGLVSSAFTPNINTNQFWNTPAANEVTGTNWATGGVAVTVTVDQDTVNNRIRMFVSDVSVATVTVSDAKHAVLYKNTGTPSTSPLVGYVTFDSALAPTAGTLTIDFDGTNGVGRFAY